MNDPSISPAPAADMTGDEQAAVARLQDAYRQLRTEMAKVVVGQERVIDELLIALFCKGHAVLVGVPGLAKTLLISTLAKTLGLSFNRIQFTPDLMPADITGTEVIDRDQASGQMSMRFVKGPVFANMILADEINRTPPKTQAAESSTACRSRSSCWRRRTRSSRRARTRCPRRSSTGSCS
jgi:MoxR-like ATPase